MPLNQMYLRVGFLDPMRLIISTSPAYTHSQVKGHTSVVEGKVDSVKLWKMRTKWPTQNQRQHSKTTHRTREQQKEPVK